MQCLTYARVSTDKQADKELSIPAQLLAMRQYAQQRGWIILEEFVDAGVSGRSTARPMLHRLLARCRNPVDRVDVVLVHKIDRLARNVADHAMIRVMLKQRGIRLASVVENLDESVSGQLVEHMMAAVAEFHSSNLSEETKKGMRQKVLQGGWPHLSPRGYRAERDGLRSCIVIDPVEGPLMAEAFEPYASGWYSLKHLARHLAAKGLVSKNLGPLPHFHLQRLLSNPFYVGRLEWQDLRVPGQHPALVSEELFKRVQHVRRHRRPQVQDRGGLVNFPLRAVAECASCGGRVTIDRRPRYDYYRCSRQSYRRDLCQAKYIPAKHAHDGLEQICRATSLPNGRSLWDVHATLTDRERLPFLIDVFDRVILAREGIVDYRLKPNWMQVALGRQRFLAA